MLALCLCVGVLVFTGAGLEGDGVGVGFTLDVRELVRSYADSVLIRLVDLSRLLCVQAAEHVDVLGERAGSPEERARVVAQRVEEDIVYAQEEVLRRRQIGVLELCDFALT